MAEHRVSPKFRDRLRATKLQAAAIPLPPPVRRARYSVASAFAGSLTEPRPSRLLDRRLGGAGDVEGELRLQVAVGQKPHAVLGAADHAGLDQSLGIDRRLASSLLASTACWIAGERHDVEVSAKMLLKPRFGRRR